MKMSGSTRRHTGLGFSEPEPPPPPASETASEAGADVAESTDGDGDTGTPVITAEKGVDEYDENGDKKERKKDNSNNGSKSCDVKKPSVAGFVLGSSS